MVKNLPAMQETPVQFLGLEDSLEKGYATHSSILGLPCGSAGKEAACNAGDLGLIPGLGGPPGEGKDYPLQYSGLENSMGCTVHGVAKSWTRLREFHSLICIHTCITNIIHNYVVYINVYIHYLAILLVIAILFN